MTVRTPLLLTLLALPAAAGAAVVGLRWLDAPTPFAALGTVPVETLSRGASPPLRVETLVGGLDTPWDLAWGPDDHLWVSERPGRISRVDPATGAIALVGRLEVFETGESGLMGLAFHPDFAREPWVYAVHTYGGRGRMRNQLVRMRFDGERLGSPEVLLNEIPGQWNHDGSRLAVGPDRLLYMTTGDAGQADLAHDLGSLAGKILRLTLEGEPAPDNPFGSAVYSWGHRNPQGLAFHPSTGLLYSAEHGPGTDDEVNLIREGEDYGWPEVRGYCDGASRTEERYCREHEVVEPLAAWTPTVGIAGLDVYTGGLVPEWDGDLLVTSLRGASLFHLDLSDDGRRVVDREAVIRGQYGRLRDVLVGPEGEIYVATSNRDGRGDPAEDDDRILVLRP
ncbi:MAG: PQQ-dependent sugar dehydrogenase [Gemmatimonadota bacterium]|nr:PQQ-dependent sugar dehydrogenase [Gemmatimonadota bacterium]